MVNENTTEFPEFRYGERGAIFTFDVRSVLARVGVSLISAEQACENAESEIPDFGFERVKDEARQTWNELLGNFEITARDRERDTAVLFYSSVRPYVFNSLNLVLTIRLVIQNTYCTGGL